MRRKRSIKFGVCEVSAENGLLGFTHRTNFVVDYIRDKVQDLFSVFFSSLVSANYTAHSITR